MEAVRKFLQNKKYPIALKKKKKSLQTNFLFELRSFRNVRLLDNDPLKKKSFIFKWGKEKFGILMD